MAKSSRAGSVKANNRRLKATVFGPVESARTERLSAKLLELAAQPKPKKEAEESADAETADANTIGASDAAVDSNMDVDKPTSSVAKRPSSGKILKKKRPNKIVFPKYKERKGKKN
ncbi:hypothetical protein B0T11DRAFT_289328 [Plectosphaerella cucumerina]|uniref:DUF2423 domain-containing protein n=1 Tax=Plectosphaerella cucumerina TaxID=40658 RepID=A0A8K0T383_9PEZI|nr:hypothetical protein B0T11DRAFT_289328 [Plectosphaerella cucumerina]